MASIWVFLDETRDGQWLQDQRVLVEHMFSCSGLADPEQTLVANFEPNSAAATVAIDAPPTAWLAIGSGARRALRVLAQLALQAALRRLPARSDAPVDGAEPAHPQTLIALLPALDVDAFAPLRAPPTAAALALTRVKRVVVLHDPNDAKAHPDQNLAGMARSGPTAGHPEHVSGIDLTPLIELHSDAIRGALCSYECMGVLVRLLRGVAPQVALPAAARTKG